MLPGTELRPVSFSERQQNEEAYLQKHSWGAHVSPMFSSYPHWKHCFQCQFLFSRWKLCLRYTVENFKENPSTRALAKILRARASEHYLIFASNSSKGQILRALSNWMGPINTLFFSRALSLPRLMHLVQSRVLDVIAPFVSE